MPRLLLTLLYFVVVVPMGGAVRLVRDPLARRWRAGAATYWSRPGAGQGVFPAGAADQGRSH
ncbi:hypothetical protein [Symbioplanes lichenis]|uniref:hypothetical protein n=1 Tax=Symbioplanes lichenis TaxID=1629072 RepID=UPI002738B669|nr:hypothetical protein [Actinoplanes lichenis]